MRRSAERRRACEYSDSEERAASAHSSEQKGRELGGMAIRDSTLIEQDRKWLICFSTSVELYIRYCDYRMADEEGNDAPLEAANGDDQEPMVMDDADGEAQGAADEDDVGPNEPAGLEDENAADMEVEEGAQQAPAPPAPGMWPALSSCQQHAFVLDDSRSLCLFHSRPAKSSNTWPGHGPLRQSKVNTKLHVVQGNVLVGGPGILSFDCTDGKFVPVSAFACSPAPSRTSHRGSLFRKCRSVRGGLHVLDSDAYFSLASGSPALSFRSELAPPTPASILGDDLDAAAGGGDEEKAEEPEDEELQGLVSALDQLLLCAIIWVHDGPPERAAGSFLGWVVTSGHLGHELPDHELRAELPTLHPHLPAAQEEVSEPRAPECSGQTVIPVQLLTCLPRRFALFRRRADEEDEEEDARPPPHYLQLLQEIHDTNVSCIRLHHAPSFRTLFMTDAWVSRYRRLRST